ncbi:MAG: acyl-ACP thioesterase domain-containing protein [Candidatus Aminicenantales bacterium]
MTELVFHKEYTIHTYETDARGLVKTVALLNFLQDSAGEHAGRLGLSVLDLVKRNTTWVLSRYHILVHRYPAMGERLEVTTWPSGKGGYFATRDFEVADANGGPVLSATSSWMIIGLERKQPLKVDDIIDIPYALDKRALDDAFASLPVPSGRDAELRFRVESTHIDWNRHVNNAVYVQWALEGVPAAVLLNKRPIELEISYRAEAFYGEEVLSVVQALPDAGAGPAYLHQILNAASGTELTRLRTRWG